MAKKIVLRHLRNSTLAGKSSEFELPAVLIGRRDDVQVKFDANRDPLVSGHHARVTLEGNDTFIEDLGSSNGTFVNGAKIAVKTRVGNHDRVTLGQAGPEFAVTMVDPAAAMIAPTVAAPVRPAVGTPPPLAAAGPTGTVAVAAPPPARPVSKASQGQLAGKSSIGMNTLMGVLSNERSKERKRTLSVVGVILAFFAVAVGATIWLFPKKEIVQKNETTIINQGGGVDWGKVCAAVEPKVYLVTIQHKGEDGRIIAEGNATAWSAAKGMLATNCHVADEFAGLKPGQTMVARPKDGSAKDLRIKSVKMHPGYAKFMGIQQQIWPIDLERPYITACDVALLVVADEDVAKQADPIPLASDEDMKKMTAQSDVALVGFPLEGLAGGAVDVSHPSPFQQAGKVARFIDSTNGPANGDDAMMFNHSIPTRGGASGSPIINKDGKVIGLHCAADSANVEGAGRINYAGYAFGQHVRLLKDLLDNKADAKAEEYAKAWRASLSEKARVGLSSLDTFIVINLMQNLNRARSIVPDIEALKQNNPTTYDKFELKPGQVIEKTLTFVAGCNYIGVYCLDPAAEFDVQYDEGKGMTPFNEETIDAVTPAFKIRPYYFGDLWTYKNGGKVKFRFSAKGSTPDKPVQAAVYLRPIPAKQPPAGQ
ncbi:MAG: trypsin-like peptidase domain-containing protein [Tepidisphaeraceae bacterium]